MSPGEANENYHCHVYVVQQQKEKQTHGFFLKKSTKFCMSCVLAQKHELFSRNN